MANSSELDKQRDIVFSADMPEQVEYAYQFLSGLADCMVERTTNQNTLCVTYNLHNHTLEGLENTLTEAGFNLDRSVLHNIERNVIYYSEDTICHNMDIPMKPTKKNERKVFIKAYDQEPHGDHDDTPPELRDYK